MNVMVFHEGFGTSLMISTSTQTTILHIMALAGLALCFARLQARQCLAVGCFEYCYMVHRTAGPELVQNHVDAYHMIEHAVL